MRQQLAVRAGGMLLGGRFRSALRDMPRAQWLASAGLRQRTEARLAPLLRHAAERVPFYQHVYRQKRLAPGALRSIADLAELPVLTKAAYRSTPETFFAEAVPAHRRLFRATSGSTGEPLAFALDRHAMPVIFASHLFYDSWFGLRPFDRHVRIMSPPAPAAGLPPGTPLAFRARQLVGERLLRLYEGRTQLRVPVWDIDETKAETIWRQVERFRPTYIMGYTSTLAELARLLGARNRRLTTSLDAIATIGETLSPLRRRTIEGYFKAPIINRYGLREFGSWSAQSCPMSVDRLHVNSELVVCEIVRTDGSLARPGEIGRVVLTDLFNYVRPFIRYDTGDLAALEPDSCPCGRGFPLLARLEGRSVECVCTPSGKLIAPIVLGHFLFVYHNNLDAVRQYQLVQVDPTRVRLLIVPGTQWNAATATRIQKDLAGLLGDDMHTTVQPVPHIPLEASGKRPIIKLMPADPVLLRQ